MSSFNEGFRAGFREGYAEGLRDGQKMAITQENTGSMTPIFKPKKIHPLTVENDRVHPLTVNDPKPISRRKFMEGKWGDNDIHPESCNCGYIVEGIY